MRSVLFFLAFSCLPLTVPAANPQARPLPEYRAKLPNGLQTVIVPLPASSRTCLALVVPAGRVFEGEEDEGVARLAAELAVATGREGSSYSIHSRVGRMHLSFRVCGARGEEAGLAESLARLTRPLPGDETAAHAAAPTAEDLAFDLLYGSLFPDHPLGRPSPDSGAGAPSPAAARSFHRSHFTPLGASLIATGDLGDPFAAGQEIGRPFLSWPVRPGPVLRTPPEERELPSAVLRDSFSGEIAEPGSTVILVGGRLGGADSPAQGAAALLLIDLAQARLDEAQVAPEPLGGAALRDGGVWVLGLRAGKGTSALVLDLAMAVLDDLAAAEVEGSELEAARARVLAGRLSRGREGAPAASDADRVLDLLLESTQRNAAATAAPGMIELSSELGIVGPGEIHAEALRIFAAGGRVVVAVDSVKR